MLVHLLSYNGFLTNGARSAHEMRLVHIKMFITYIITLLLLYVTDGKNVLRHTGGELTFLVDLKL